MTTEIGRTGSCVSCNRPSGRNRAAFRMASNSTVPADGSCWRGRPAATRRAAIRPHDDRLLGSYSSQQDVGIEPGGACKHLEIAATATALKAAADVSARLGPGSGNHAALVNNAGLQIELVGVAGAGEGHVHGGARDRIGCAAADTLFRPVIKGDSAAAGPISGHPGERS